MVEGVGGGQPIIGLPPLASFDSSPPCLGDTAWRLGIWKWRVLANHEIWKCRGPTLSRLAWIRSRSLDSGQMAGINDCRLDSSTSVPPSRYFLPLFSI